MQATQKAAPRILYAWTVLTHILEVRPEKCGFSAYSASWGAHEKCADIGPTFICSNCQSDGSEYFRLKINAVGCRLLLHCVSFASNFRFQFKQTCSILSRFFFFQICYYNQHFCSCAKLVLDTPAS
jgi:hypothetical protein